MKKDKCGDRRLSPLIARNAMSRAPGERGRVRVNFQEWPVEIKARPPESFTDESSTQRPLIRKVRE